VRFVFYTEKTVSQCLTAINERMHVKGTTTRPALDGWVEKGGAFALSLSAPVIGKFSRRTTLKAQAERESGITVVRGSVPGGTSREGQAIVFVALLLVALTIIGSGNVLVGLFLIPVAAYLYIPLHGDYQNSDVLLDEVQKTLKAKLIPPKLPTDPKQAKATAAAPKPARATSPAAKSSTAKSPKPKPAAAKPAAPTPARTTRTTRSPAAKQPPAPPTSEFPLMPDVPPEPKPSSPRPTPKPATPRATTPRPPAEKKPPAPPASEFPELPGEAPP
jgi:hypothetical protein